MGNPEAAMFPVAPVQHTPGPWTLHEGAHGAQRVKGPERPYGSRQTPISDTICMVEADWNTHREFRANARLIAAAPDMLAALRLAATVRPENWNDGDDPESAAAWHAVAAAINRAEGR